MNAAFPLTSSGDSSESVPLTPMLQPDTQTDWCLEIIQVAPGCLRELSSTSVYEWLCDHVFFCDCSPPAVCVCLTVVFRRHHDVFGLWGWTRPAERRNSEDVHARWACLPRRVSVSINNLVGLLSHADVIVSKCHLCVNLRDDYDPLSELLLFCSPSDWWK